MNIFSNKHFLIIIGAGIIILIVIYSIGSGRVADKKEILQKESDQKQASPEDLTESYRNDVHAFSFQYPSYLVMREFSQQEGGEVILAERSGSKEGFQILVSPFDSNEPLTKERLLQEAVDITIADVQEISFAGVAALLFWSDDPVIGKTREVWFAHDGTLYQISSPDTFDSVLSRIMATWRFQ